MRVWDVLQPPIQEHCEYCDKENMKSKKYCIENTNLLQIFKGALENKIDNATIYFMSHNTVFL